jgi:hypothetical protein
MIQWMMGRIGGAALTTGGQSPHLKTRFLKQRAISFVDHGAALN